jgi:hypothetical protein
MSLSDLEVSCGAASKQPKSRVFIDRLSGLFPKTRLGSFICGIAVGWFGMLFVVTMVNR